jgi:hypothetical protein
MCYVFIKGRLMNIGRLSLFAGILLLGMLSSLYAGEDVPFITDDEEYAVIAAVFFPESDPAVVNNAKEQPQENGAYRHPQYLSGIPSNHFNLNRLTSTRSLSDKSLDPAMVDDFNRKNAQQHRIDPDKFNAVAPKGSSVTLIVQKRFDMNEKPTRIRSGTTYISRPGFNKTRSKAAIDVSHVADPEMGIGYQVMLEKSLQNGKWYIVDAVVNRRY